MKGVLNEKAGSRAAMGRSKHTYHIGFTQVPGPAASETRSSVVGVHQI